MILDVLCKTSREKIILRCHNKNVPFDQMDFRLDPNEAVFAVVVVVNLYLVLNDIAFGILLGLLFWTAA